MFTQDIDTILQRPFKEEDLKTIRQLVPHALHKTDKSGNPLIILNGGKTETARLREKYSDHGLMQFHLQIVEYYVKQKFIKPVKSGFTKIVSRKRGNDKSNSDDN